MSPAAAETRFFQTPPCRCALKERAVMKNEAVSSNRKPVSTRIMTPQHPQTAFAERSTVDFEMQHGRFGDKNSASRNCTTQWAARSPENRAS